MSTRNSDEALLRFKLRVERLEGKQEDIFWFVSKASAMAQVNEAISLLRRDSMKGLDQEPTVLIIGEKGTGKEGIARMIHLGSRRGKSAWVTVQCNAMTDADLDTEIFGSSTSREGPVDKMGCIEVARGGTLFLNEIGRIGLEIQSKIVRVLLAHAADLNVRVIATISESSELLMQDGLLLKDFYDRLSHVKIAVPSLRQRQEDILPMTLQFGEYYFSKVGKIFEGFTAEAENLIQNYFWPGNVNELANVVERVALLSQEKGLATAQFLAFKNQNSSNSVSNSEIQLVTDAPTAGQNYTLLKKQWCDLFEKNYLSNVLNHCHGNVSASAREVKLDRSNFLRLLRKHGLKAQGYRKIA